MPEHRIYLDHAATAPLLPEAGVAMQRGFDIWANPSSPHKEGRSARSALEDARARIAAALGWTGEIIFTSGASEALAIAIGHCREPLAAVTTVEHEAVLRHAEHVARLAVDRSGMIDPASAGLGGLVAVQQVNNETGVIQPLAPVAAAVREAGGLLLADCAQGAGKIALPEADLVAIAAHKFGGPVGVGALLIRDWAMLEATGGQERGYRAGTENLPAVLAMAAALEAGNGWLDEAARLRGLLEREIVHAGGEIIAAGAARVPTIGMYRMPGMSSAAQLIRFDAMGLAVSAGSACSSGSLKASHVIEAMGIDAKAGSEVIRVSIGRGTGEAEIRAFIHAWTEIAKVRAAA